MPRPRLLYLAHRVPHPPNRGDRIRTYHLLRHLSQHADVSLACLADEPVSEETHRELNRLCVRVGIVPVEKRLRWLRAGRSLLRGRTISEGAFQSPGLTRLLNDWGATTRFDATLASSSALAPYLQLPALSSAKANVDLIDVDSQKWLDYAAATRGPKTWLYRLEGQRMRTLEASLATWAQRLLVVSEAEADIFRAFCPNSPITALANGVDVDYFQPSLVEGRGSRVEGSDIRQPTSVLPSTLNPQPSTTSCVFVGALDYKPNIDGAIWFCRNVWPRIRHQKPNAVICLVGREPTREVRALAEIPGVEVIGTVPDVRPYLAEAAVVVVPLQIARGVQNKVLEAMAMGKAIVAAPEPIVGLQVESGVHLLRASNVDEWVSQVTELFDDASLRDELGTAALAYVTAYHRWEQCLESLPRLLFGQVDGTNRIDGTNRSYASHSSYPTAEEVTP